MRPYCDEKEKNVSENINRNDVSFDFNRKPQIFYENTGSENAMNRTSNKKDNTYTSNITKKVLQQAEDMHDIYDSSKEIYLP